MNALLSRLAKPHATGWILLLAVVLHWPVMSSAHFFADDFIQHFAFQGDSQLEQQGFAGSKTPGSLAFAIEHQFLFFNPHHDNYTALQESGSLPWWLADDAQIHFWRPLTTLSHWLDYQLWPDSPQLMHVHSAAIVFLAWLAFFFVYKRLLPNSAWANVALLLLVLDVSLVFPLDWLAARNSLLLLLIAPLMLLALLRKNVLGYSLALLAYGAALLSAEAGVSFLGFVLAYLCFLNDKSWRHKLGLFGAFLAITVLWRSYYHMQHYGALGVGHYIDMLYAPWAFIQHALLFYPVLVVHTLSGAEGVDFYLQGHWRYLLALLGYGLLALPIIVARRLAIANNVWGFFYLSALLSLVPLSSIALSDPRMSVLPFAFFAPALAMIIVAFFQRQQALLATSIGVKSIVYLAIACHIVISTLALLALSLLPSQNSDAADARFNQFDTDAAHILIINSVDPFRLMYQPYRTAFYQQTVPASVRSLLLAQSTVHIERLSETEYQLTQQQGMRLSVAENIAYNPMLVGGVEGMSHLLMGFFHDGNYDFYSGQPFDYAESEIRITQLVDKRPKSIIVRLKKTDITWLFWDWHSRQYQQLPTLAVGETREIKGKHDYIKSRFF